MRDHWKKGQIELHHAGAPDDVIESMSSVRGSPSVVLARKFLEMSPRDARFLVLLGTKGIGKTVAACVALMEIIRRELDVPMASGGGNNARRPGLFVTAMEFNRMSLFDRSANGWFEKLLDTPGLVIDDLGAEMQTDMVRGLIYELLNTRYNRTRRTIITSNLDKRTLAERYGERVTDRLRERGLSGEFTGQSLRPTMGEAPRQIAEVATGTTNGAKPETYAPNTERPIDATLGDLAGIGGAPETSASMGDTRSLADVIRAGIRKPQVGPTQPVDARKLCANDRDDGVAP